MPALQNNGGDVLARGAARATFRPAGESKTDEEWAAMWEGFDAEAYRNAPNPATQSGQGIKADSSGSFVEPTEEPVS